MQRVSGFQTVASFRALIKDGERAGFGQQGVMPKEWHEGVADGGIDFGELQVGATDFCLQVVCHEHAVAAVLIMIKDGERAGFGQQGVMP